MAIIGEIITAGGITVYVDDDCMCARGSEEERRAIEEQRRAAYEIMVRAKEREQNGT